MFPITPELIANWVSISFPISEIFKKPGDIPETVKDLLSIDPRFRFTFFYDDLTKGMKEQYGYIPTKTNIFIPYGMPTAAHQIAHMVEMNDIKRCLLPDWGMNSKPFITNGKSPTTKQFMPAIVREIRVRTIQDILNGQTKNYKFSDMVCNHPAWGVWLKQHIGFGRFKKETDVMDWVRDLHENALNAWSVDRVRYEWKIRTDYIFNWMETV